VGVAVKVGVSSSVTDGVRVTMSVSVPVGVTVGVALRVGVSLSVTDGVRVTMSVSVPVGVTERDNEW